MSGYNKDRQGRFVRLTGSFLGWLGVWSECYNESGTVGHMFVFVLPRWIFNEDNSELWWPFTHWAWLNCLNGLMSTIGKILDSSGKILYCMTLYDMDLEILGSKHSQFNVIFLLQSLNKEQISPPLLPLSLHIEQKIFSSLHGWKFDYSIQYHLSLWHYFCFWDRVCPRILDLVPLSRHNWLTAARRFWILNF